LDISTMCLLNIEWNSGNYQWFNRSNRWRVPCFKVQWLGRRAPISLCLERRLYYFPHSKWTRFQSLHSICPETRWIFEESL